MWWLLGLGLVGLGLYEYMQTATTMIPIVGNKTNAGPSTPSTLTMSVPQPATSPQPSTQLVLNTTDEPSWG